MSRERRRARGRTPVWRGNGRAALGSLRPPGELQLPLRETPLPAGATVFPAREGPFPKRELNVPAGERGVPNGELTFPGRERAFPLGESPFPKRELTLPSGERAFPQWALNLPGRRRISRPAAGVTARQGARQPLTQASSTNLGEEPDGRVRQAGDSGKSIGHEDRVWPGRGVVRYRRIYSLTMLNKRWSQ
jgi:hypothetical protein